MTAMSYVVSLKQFDGPLDLLLSLITHYKLDIRDIFISEITEQYLAATSRLDDLDMDSASEFLRMAAVLLEIKSRALLPSPPKQPEEGEESPEEALIRRLTEYKAYKEACEDMRGLEERARQMYGKLPDEFPLPPPRIELSVMAADKLAAAFIKVMRKFNETGNIIPAEREIQRDIYTVQSCMLRIQSKIRNERIKFEQLFDGIPTRSEVVTLFIAMLELLRLNRLKVSQRGRYGEIYLYGKGA
jgi:segregation and condensation protein A